MLDKLLGGRKLNENDVVHASNSASVTIPWSCVKIFQHLHETSIVIGWKTKVINMRIIIYPLMILTGYVHVAGIPSISSVRFSLPNIRIEATTIRDDLNLIAMSKASLLEEIWSAHIIWNEWNWYNFSPHIISVVEEGIVKFTIIPMSYAIRVERIFQFGYFCLQFNGEEKIHM